MTKQELEMLRLQARIVALEGLVSSLVAAYSVAVTDKDELIAKLRQYPGEMEKVAFQDMSPEESDLYSAELRDAVDSLVEFLVRAIKRKQAR
jgi:hypothetical protein